MSAAYDNFKKGWITLAVSFCLTIITVFLGFRLQATDLDVRDFDKKFEEKADKTWVREQINDNNKIQDVKLDWLMKTLERVDKRTERLEDRQMKN